VRQLKIAEKQKSKATHVAAAVASRSPAVVTAKTAYKTGKATTSVLPKLIGLGMAGTGLAHFVVPQAFESITKLAFPENTREWTYANGASETLIGLALSNSRSRVYGLIGVVAYVGFLGRRVVQA
jgi:hypothetical protein